MTNFLRFLAAILVAALLVEPACTPENRAYLEKTDNPVFIHAGIRRITDIIRHDVFAPPVSSRIYAYSSVAAYEALVPGYPEYQSLAGQLNGLKPGPQPEAGKEYCFPLASANALLIVGRTLVFSEENIDTLQEQILQDFQKMGMPPEVYDRSKAYGEAVAKHILAWSKGDNYAQTRSAPKYPIDPQNPTRWRPTAPMYVDAVEPHWCEIRPWALDSAAQFKADACIPFSTDKNSDFYRAANEVLEISQNLTAEQTATAWYWDDNPAATQVYGHFMYTLKKISPGGHWMTITGYACRKQNLNLIQSTEAYAKVACALADGFISCWTEKYRSCVIRPETYINQYIKSNWQPLIQTPPFPEHTSGHSTISAAAAAVLTNLFGDNFAFTDSTEVEFQMPPRTFSSFYQASDEAGMSRLYGGIHYRHGNVAGSKNGREVGQYVFDKVKTRR